MSGLFSRLGIGAATVETRLSGTTVHPGDRLGVTVDLEAGGSAETLDSIAVSVETDLGRESHTLDRQAIAESVSVEPEERRTFETAVDLPLWTPLTAPGQRVWLTTTVEVGWGRNRTDQADIEVVAGPISAALFDALATLGFEREGTTLETPAWVEDRPFVQTVRYVPGPDPYRTDLDALEIALVPRATELHSLVRIDEHEPAEEVASVEFDKHEVFHTFDTADPRMVANELRRLIDRFAHTD